jgi:hypothetical protein
LSFRSAAEESAFVCHSERSEESPHLPFSEGAWGFSPTNKPRRIKGLQPRIFFFASHPQKPQQIPLSSPSTPQNPHNSHSINHFHPKNSWHSSYAPLDTLNIWIKSIEGQFDRAEINSRRPLATLFLNRISHTKSTSYPRIPTRHSGAAPEVVILAQPQEPSFW